MGAIVYLLFAVAAIAAIAGGWNQLGHHFTDPVVASYEGPDGKLTKANARAEEAIAANNKLRADLGKIREDVATCNTATEKFKEEADAATKRATAATAAAAARARAGQPAISALRTKAAQPAPVGVTCEQERAEAKAILSDLSRDVRSALGLEVTVGPIKRLPPNP